MACPTCQYPSDYKSFHEKIYPLKYSDEKEGYYCKHCSYLYPVIENIVIALPKDRIKEENSIERIREFINKNHNEDEEFIEGKYLNYSHYLRYKHYKEVINELDRIEKDTILFDIGCGGGAMSKYSKGKYIGLEREINRLLVASLNKKHIFILGDILHLPLRTASIKKFISFAVIEHTLDFNLAIQNLKRVASKVGFIAVPARDRFNFLDDPVNYIRLKNNQVPVYFGVFAFGHMGMLDYLGWRGLLIRKGFEIFKEGTEKKTIISQCLNLILYILFYKRKFNDVPVGIITYRKFKYIARLWEIVKKFDFCLFKQHMTVEFFVRRRFDNEQNI